METVQRWWLKTANSHLARRVQAMTVPRTRMEVAFTTREDLAQQLLLIGQQVGPRIKADLEREAKKKGGHLEGVQHMYKPLGSLVRKLTDKYGPVPDDQVVMKITDFVRFTVVFHPSVYADAIQDLIWALEGSGYRVVEEESSWMRGDPYSAIHFILEEPSRHAPFELQFHTEESFTTKNEAIHALYEEFRAGGTSLDRKRELYDIMARYWDQVQIPDDVLRWAAPLLPGEGVDTFPNPKFYPRP